MITEVPWQSIPISEPVLPGEESVEWREANGYPVYVLALVSTIAGISTSEARRLVEQEQITIDGVTAPPTFVYLKPGALVIVGDHRYRIGPPR
jgi:hypothetical protein